MTDPAIAAHKRLSKVLPRRVVTTDPAGVHKRMPGLRVIVQRAATPRAEPAPRAHYLLGRQSMLLDALRRRGPCTTTELAEWLAWDARQTSYAMTDLRRDGKVEYMRRGQRHYWSAK